MDFLRCLHFLFKLSITLQSSIDEAVYRWNTRKASQSERFSDMFDQSIGLVRKWSEIRIGLVAA